jgi:hypothetical protein
MRVGAVTHLATKSFFSAVEKRLVRNLSYETFFSVVENRLIWNLIRSKLKKGFEFVANLETLFRFRTATFFSMWMALPLILFLLSCFNKSSLFSLEFSNSWEDIKGYSFKSIRIQATWMRLLVRNRESGGCWGVYTPSPHNAKFLVFSSDESKFCLHFKLF